MRHTRTLVERKGALAEETELSLRQLFLIAGGG